jgi:hypothetical protein
MIESSKMRKHNATALGVFICLTIGSVALACGGRNSSATATQVVPREPKSSQPSISAIRKVDFKNFVYPKLPTAKCSMDEVRLQNGRYEAPADVAGKRPAPDCWSIKLGRITYGDVTGDGNEEAIVELYAEAGGTEAAEDVYVYTIADGKAVMLWKFATGDRADGGLRRIAAEQGELVVDLFGMGTAIGKKLYGTENVGACCPKHFTRTKYMWDGTRFRVAGREVVFDNPNGSSAPANDATPAP